MRAIDRFRHRLSSLFRKQRLESELSEEFRYHLEREVEENLARGMSAGAARSAARQTLGAVAQLQEECRDARGTRPIEIALQDLRYGVRLARKSPAFTAAAVLTLALGMCATTTIFSVVYCVVLNPLPYRDPSRLVSLWGRMPRFNMPRANVTAANYLDWRAQNHTLEDLALVRAVANYNLTGDGDPERFLGARSTASLFSVLGVQPIIGRAFTAENEKLGRGNLVLLSHRLWTRRFAADPAVAGRTIRLNGEPFTILGVMPPAFHYPSNEFDLWVPLYIHPDELTSRLDGNYVAVGRLKPRVTLPQLQADLDVISAQLARQYPQNVGVSAGASGLLDDTVGKVRDALYILLAAVGCLLLIGCVNVASLFLARGLARSRERAVRAALGASTLRLAFQALLEVVPVVVAGAALGIASTSGALRALVAILPAGLPRVDEIQLSLPVLAFSVALLAATSLLVAFWPAWQSAGAAPADALHQEARGSSGSRIHLRLRELLVAFEIALTILLLAGAGLLMRSFTELSRVPLGFDTRNVLSMGLAVPRAKYGPDTAVANFLARLLDRVQSVPGVRAAGMVNRLPLGGGTQNGPIDFEGNTPPLNRIGNCDWRTATPDYFRAMGIPLVAGRLFTEADRADSKSVGLIDDRTARQFFPNRSPIGHRFRIPGPNMPWVEIVGVVGHIRHDGADAEPRSQVYWSYHQRTQDRMALAVRTEGDPAKWALSVIAAIRSIDPDQPVYGVAPMEEVAGRSLAQKRLETILIGTFAGLALLLAAIGVYGVTAYAVERRVREFGIRMALGANPGQLVGLVMRRVAVICTVGAAAGLAASAALGGAIRAVLFRVSPTDWFSYVTAAVVLFTVALLAAWIPSRRSAAIDPLLSLRAE